MNQEEQPSLSFPQDLWEQFDLLCKRTETGIHACKEVLDYFKKRASIEEEFARNLGKYFHKPAQQLEDSPTLSKGWATMYSMAELQATLHNTLASSIDNNLCHPLQKLVKDMETRRKQMITDGNKLHNEIRDFTEAVKRAQAKYERSSRDMEVARQDLIAAIDKDDAAGASADSANKTPNVQKAEKRLQKAESDNIAAEAEYKQQVKDANDFLQIYQNDRMPKLLEDFEQFEMMRMHFLKSNMKNLILLMQELPPALSHELSAAAQVLDSVSIEGDIQQFVRDHHSPKQAMPPFAFEPYVEGKVPRKGTGNSFTSGLRTFLSGKPSERPSSPPLVRPAHAVYGVTLEEALLKTQPTAELPRVLTYLVDSIIRTNGHCSEGLFRLVASQPEIQTAKRLIDDSDYDLIEVRDPNCYASLLKYWLRELVEPLIPSHLYETAISDPYAAAGIIPQLPPAHRSALIYVVHFLQFLSRPEIVERTRMPASNLAIIFGPLFLRCPSDDPSVLLKNTNIEKLFVESLLKNVAPSDQFNAHIPPPLLRESATPPASPPPQAIVFSQPTEGEPAVTEVTVAVEEPAGEPTTDSGESNTLDAALASIHQKHVSSHHQGTAHNDADDESMVEIGDTRSTASDASDDFEVLKLEK